MILESWQVEKKGEDRYAIDSIIEMLDMEWGLQEVVLCFKADGEPSIKALLELPPPI